MGRVGSSSDNAAMESFFSLLQKNVLNTRRWNTREELRLAIVVWIETKYNRRRRQRGLVPRQVVGRVSSISKLGMVGSARPAWTSAGRFQAIASCGRTWL
ncbi:hypothetical protein B7R23_16865 [Subtercola boreus]|nr:hypothetical protein B7R23_16865 [Subtercola boreus]RFA17718.1 hypothetical protein B7R24_16615 [Subtercola boreus]